MSYRTYVDTTAHILPQHIDATDVVCIEEEWRTVLHIWTTLERLGETIGTSVVSARFWHGSNDHEGGLNLPFGVIVGRRIAKSWEKDEDVVDAAYQLMGNRLRTGRYVVLQLLEAADSVGDDVAYSFVVLPKSEPVQIARRYNA